MGVAEGEGDVAGAIGVVAIEDAGVLVCSSPDLARRSSYELARQRQPKVAT